MAFSINLLTQKSYQIPIDLDDSDEIKRFLDKNKNKKVIVVQGLGFVGAVMSLVCANSLTEEYAVIGVDLANENTFWKIKSINDGVFPLIADDPKIEKFFESANVAKHLRRKAIKSLEYNFDKTLITLYDKNEFFHELPVYIKI